MTSIKKEPLNEPNPVLCPGQCKLAMSCPEQLPFPSFFLLQTLAEVDSQGRNKGIIIFLGKTLPEQLTMYKVSAIL